MNNKKQTFNITVKLNTEEEREIILDILDSYVRRHKCKNMIRFDAKSANVFYSENEGIYFNERERVVN
tara:strand:+ start:536 stop:739 length:204 start_codon:yes stop_codon:yes gene_type:complete